MGDLARRRGATIMQKAKLLGATSGSGGEFVLDTTRGQVTADVVVNAAGGWAGAVGDLVGAPVTLKPQRHQAITVTLSKPLGYVMPSVMDYVPGSGRAGLYFGHENETSLFAGLHTEETIHAAADPDTVSLNVDESFVEEIAGALAERLPHLEGAVLGRGWAGLYPMSFDQQPVVGPHPGNERVICALGAGGNCIQLAPAIGKTVAEYIDGDIPSLAGPGSKWDSARIATSDPAVAGARPQGGLPVSNQLNYASTSTDAKTATAFEGALANARAPGGALAHLIDGQQVATGDVFVRLNPAHPNETVSEAHSADADIVATAVAAARAAQLSWRRTPARERAKALLAALGEFEDRKVEIAGVLSAETGKSRLEALGEAQEVVDLIGTYTTQLVEMGGDFRRPMNTADPREETTDLLRPYGVFAVVGPFNFPAALNVNMATGALLMGNTVVLKPSDKAPHSGAIVGEVLAKHLPTGVVNLVHGGAATGKALAEADVDGIAFTGSAEIGWNLVRAFHSGPYGRPVLAEMGGKNVAVVSRNADIDAAAEGVFRSAFGLSGQKCSACSRVVVDAEVHDEFVAKLAERVNTLTVSAPENADAFMGPVIDEAAVKRFDDAVETARSGGGTINAGGDRPEREGYFVNPTVVSNLPLGHDLTRTELFLPFVTVTKVHSFDAAIDEANAVDYGLAAGVFSLDDTEVEEFLDRMEAGVLYVNRRSGATTGAWPGIQSFCGWKSSGSSGKGGLGPWYLPGFTREQSRTLPVRN